ncbi:MAG: NAD(P)-binding domain-containing protein [Ginsengibacter sp.]
MALKKTLAIVGATEKNGRILVNQFACMPYRLLLVSNKLGELQQLSNDISKKYQEADLESLECVKDGCWEADIIVLAVPVEDIQKVAEVIKEVATQKIVVEISDQEQDINELKKILPNSKLVRILGNLQSKEIVIKGDNEIVNEEIMKIFN